MTTLPDAAFFSGEITNGEAKTAQDDLLAVIRELPGGSAPTTLTVSSGGRILPTAAVHYVDTQGQAAADDLWRIGIDNHPPGRLLLLLPADAGRAVTVQHDSLAAAEGPLLIGAANATLGPEGTSLLLLRVGNGWTEISRESPPPISGRLRRITQFEASGSYSKSSWLRLAVVRVWGAGGGGAAGYGASASGSGGGGGFAERMILASEMAATVTVTVGARGIGGIAGALSGSAGGTSSFGAFCSATGGDGGIYTAAAGAAGGDGGQGFGGNDIRHGGRGLSGGEGISMGGSAPLGGHGGGGAYGGTTAYGGRAGGTPGGGGGSGFTWSGGGGAGGFGLVIIYEYE